MKKLYTTSIALTCLILFNSCSKDFLRSYEDRIVGTWVLEEINRVGFGGSTQDLPFRGGSFVFSEGGGLTYTDPAGNVYSGSWDIQRHTYEERTVRTLQLHAVNFSSQNMKSEYFEEMNFTGTNKFKAYLQQGLHRFVFHFER